MDANTPQSTPPDAPAPRRRLRFRASKHGADVDLAIEYARQRYAAGEPDDIVAPPGGKPLTHTAAGEPTDKVETHLRRDGQWNVLRDETGAVVYAYQDHHVGRHVKRLSEDEKIQFLEGIKKGFGVALTLQLVGCDRKTLKREFDLDPDFKERAKLAEDALLGWATSTLVEASQAGSLQAAAAQIAISHRVRSARESRDRWKKEHALREAESRAKRRFLGDEDGSAVAVNVGALGADFERFAALDDRVRRGDPLTDEETLELGRFMVRLSAPEVKARRLAALEAADAALPAPGSEANPIDVEPGDE